ncbi:HTTM domain-containing protein [Ichthyenterobacterium magnum]|uniref:Vitamin K-dependent gamma-carboxylase-like protein n=1 Tax=Ichthyenterobacterium magnum TaxID=1230530 RepID=A0A420DWK8_9FLAO|nr:HTTM domain-containing protein [Ichthyenterobacterium magnum]RKE98614.1 vitamin K-dependent gamma-carboxylase-like protein [Ichthyenterobacterium magnum]
MYNFLFKHIDNSSLIVFRIIFGLLIFLESVGAIFTGWIKRTLIEPEFTFSFIGFEWLQPLPENWMYAYYAVMGVFGLFVMVGYKYRWSMFAFTLMWSCTYFMQKSSYNNHYYLLMLLSALMIFQPANKYLSVDSKSKPSIISYSMPQWSRYIFILQMFIVYTYASVAKLYPDWLNVSVPELLMKSKQHYLLVGELLQQKWMHYFVAYGGILFDGLIIPLLLWKPTRKLAFIASIFFHLFNSIIFQVGIFPYLSLAFALFFFNPKTIQKLFLKKKPYYNQSEIITPKYSSFFVALFFIYFAVQIILPLRHHFIKDNVLWTEEGHRLSWRMMLRSKSGFAQYKVIDKASGTIIPINLNDYLTKKQQRGATTKPDVIWQFAQHLKKKYAENGVDIQVFVNCNISINGKPRKTLINPEIDIANVEWSVFKHNDWILPSKQD